MRHRKTQGDGERLYLLVQHLGQRLRDVDVACGITPARFSALAHLVFHGVSRPAMTRLVRDMEKSGLVRRRADSSDGRAVLVEITTKGRAVVERVRTRKIALVSAELETLDTKSCQAVRTALEALGH